MARNFLVSRLRHFWLQLRGTSAPRESSEHTQESSVDDLVMLYEKGLELDKQGKVDEAAAAYTAAFELIAEPDSASRRKLVAGKLANLYWRAGKDKLSKKWYDVLGQPMPKRESAISFNRALNALQKTGRCTSLAPKLKEAILQRLYGEDFEEEDVELLPFLQAFYDEDMNEAVKDGFIHHDWRFGQETDDAPSEFAKLVGGTSPFLKQIAQQPDLITLERPNGEHLSLPIQSLNDVAAAFNQELENLGDERRFVALETDGDWHAYYLFDKNTFKTLCRSKTPVLPCESVPGVDEKRWVMQPTRS